MVAVVLDRVPAKACAQVSDHLARLLRREDLDQAPLFTVRESVPDRHGLLPESDVAPIRRWLDGIAGSERTRRRTARHTLLGALAAVGPCLETLAQAAQNQVDLTTGLADSVRCAYGTAMFQVDSGLRGATLLRGEVLLRWHELLTSGDLQLALRAERLRRTVVNGRLAPGIGFQTAVAAALAELVVEANVTAAQDVRRRWLSEPAGRQLLGADPTLGRPRPGFADAAHDVVHEWQRWLRALARTQAQGVRARARPYATAARVLLATVAAVAPPLDGATAAAETAAARAGRVADHGTATRYAAMLGMVMAQETVRKLGEHARGEFLVRAGALLAAEVDRGIAAVVAAGADHGLAYRLRGAAAHLLGALFPADILRSGREVAPGEAA
jgi:hypothetical protein